MERQNQHLCWRKLQLPTLDWKAVTKAPGEPCAGFIARLNGQFHLRFPLQEKRRQRSQELGQEMKLCLASL